MHITKDDVPTKLEAPGALARQVAGFGDAGDGVEMAGEYFSLGAGTDIAPLLAGLDGDLCQAPHWGFVIRGTLVVTYSDGSEETCRGNDLFHWPAGHSVRVEEDADVVLFSPLAEHAHVLEHMGEKLAGMAS